MSYYDLDSFEKELDILFPFNSAEEWDNVGLQIANENIKVKKVLITLDLNLKVIKYAKKNSFDVILAHHPLINQPLNKINAIHDYKSILVKNLILSNIAFIALHTNLDRYFNELLSKKLGLKKIKPLTADGLGSYGYLSRPVKLKDFINAVKEKLVLKKVEYAGDDNKVIKCVAAVGGSGTSYFNNTLKQKRIDVFITGDVRYHTALDAQEGDIAIIDAGHFSTETIMLPELKKLLQKKFRKKIFFEISVNKNPIKIY